MPPRFMLASANRHKLQEFRAILQPFEVLPMPPGIELPPEGVESFADNALLKARSLAEAVCARAGDSARRRVERPGATEAAAGARGPDVDGLLFIADDSGLEAEALGWAPGVTSARYAGVDGPGADKANVARLLRELAGAPGPVTRRARFVCSLVAVTVDLREYAVSGYWWGAIGAAPRGEGGFGYDPVFIPEGSDLTVAEWPQELKDQASHRALAGKALLERLRREGVIGVTVPS